MRPPGFLEFFAATIGYRNTCAAYHRAVCSFFVLRLATSSTGSMSVPIWSRSMSPPQFENLQATAAKPRIKLPLAAVRRLFDWLVVGHVFAANPAHAVRGPLDATDIERLFEPMR